MENINENCSSKVCQKLNWCACNFWFKALNWIIAILVLAVLANWLGLGLKQDRPVNTISVSGKGEIVVKPDIATISFGVSAESMDVAKAQSESATKMNNIIDFLKKNGVDEKDIKTTNYSIYPRYDYNRISALYPNGGNQVLAGYVVSQNVEVKIRKIEDAGAILGGVGGFGVTDVSGLNFSLDKADEKKDEARDLAIEDARAQAKVLAKSLGVRLGDVSSFSENGNYPMYYAMEKSVAMGMGGDSVAPQLPTGESKITSNVTITYEIR
jgi:uncharacterized protein YggE